MDVFLFVSWCLALLGAVTLLWPLNIPFVALAYKVRRGPKPLDIGASEYWWRCTFGGLGLAVLTMLFLGLLFLLVKEMELPRGPVQVVLFIAYLPAAVGFLFWILALEDMLQALGVFILFVAFFGLPLLLLGRFAGWWTALRQSAPWLLPPA